VKALVAVALVLGLAGFVLGLVAVLRGSDGYEALTLELQGGQETRSEAPATHAEPGNRSPAAISVRPAQKTPIASSR
jgi:hypothetical protein